MLPPCPIIRISSTIILYTRTQTHEHHGAGQFRHDVLPFHRPRSARPLHLQDPATGIFWTALPGQSGLEGSRHQSVVRHLPQNHRHPRARTADPSAHPRYLLKPATDSPGYWKPEPVVRLQPPREESWSAPPKRKSSKQCPTPHTQTAWQRGKCRLSKRRMRKASSLPVQNDLHIQDRSPVLRQQNGYGAGSHAPFA